MSILLLILGLILFVLLVVVHEFGHFIVARRNGVKVDEFGIGFPPRAKIIGTKKGTVYTLNWLPLGGFVRLHGEHDSDRKSGSYGAASLSTKVKIMIAGVSMNLLAAFVLLTVIALVGMPQLINGQFSIKSDSKIIKNEVIVGYVQADSPAEKGGLRPGDRLESIGAVGAPQLQIQNADNLPVITKKLAGKQVIVHYEHSGTQKTVNLTIQTLGAVAASQKTKNPEGYLGVSQVQYTLTRSSWSAPIVAAGLIKQFTVLTLRGLGSAIGGLLRGNTAQASAQVSGPVGIFVILKNGSLLGYQFVLMIVAVISLTLAIMNILPIPALDGGKLFMTLLFRVMRRPLNEKTEDWAQGVGFTVLMILVILITVVDVSRLH